MQNWNVEQGRCGVGEPVHKNSKHQPGDMANDVPGAEPTDELGDAVVEVINGAGQSPIVLVCEHASNYIPGQLNGLGLDQAALQSHVAWDPGALGVAQAMSALLDAPLAASKISRLVYDCNRAPHALSAMPVKSEIYDIPGNARLTDVQRQERIETYYMPFQTQLAACLDDSIAKPPTPDAVSCLVTIHSFTRVYNNVPRDVEIGILHDSDARLADELLRGCLNASAYDIRRNDPYGPSDGVTHTLKEHGTSRGLANVMIEICNDLIIDEAAQLAMAQLLTAALREALCQLSAAATDHGAQRSLKGAASNG